MSTPIIQVNHLSLFIEDETVLSNISFSIQKGECIALTGASGSGKTILSKIIAGHIKPTSGQVKKLGSN
ncbi:ATP-binding cassette domain-containing protein [uncultured Cytophaga sp.]|uniref:ATP-binding cassette domain-containing protein n=1 Tax=uncultured Cytophaga sp. TaxID=160238 RepID=UPI002621C5C4|nr:ATP-binding cassette domain-containing protein [uncultured Cytophaga sp.]